MKKFANFEDALLVVSNIGISNTKEWREWIKNNKSYNIPYNPDRIYKNDGWVNYNHFWGKRYKRKKFMTYHEAMLYVKKHNIKTHFEFTKLVNNIDNMPSDPKRIYINDGWVNWGTFLGTGKYHTKKFIKYEECKDIIVKYKLSGYLEFKKWIKLNNEYNIPANPHIYYKDKGWVSWDNFLSNDNKSNIEKSKMFLTYPECKEYINKFKLTSSNEYSKIEKPYYIPTSPHIVYKNKGWISWSDFLDNNNISKNKKSKLFFNYDDAKEFVTKLKFSDKYEYKQYIKNNNINFLPIRPESFYKKNWTGFLEFLGCEPERTSYGERKIKEILIENKINFIREKRFEGCVNKIKLPFDFYLPGKEICIEYDGQHHFNSVSKYGGTEFLKKVQKNDDIKNKWCDKNNIRLLRISYKNKNKITEILSKFLEIEKN